MPRNLVRHRLLHGLRTAALLVAMTAVLALVGFLLGGPGGVAVSLGFALVFALFAPSASPERLMRARGARPLHPAEAPGLHGVVAELARRAGLPRSPELYLVPLAAPQAMAMHRGERALIGITPSLLRLLGPEETIAVVAHEISHLAHGDLWTLRLTETVRGLTRSMSSLGLILVVLSLPLLLVSGVQVPWLGVLLLIVAPRIVGMLALAVSRSRELDADVGAVALTRDPRSLARALSRIEESARGPWWMQLVRFELPGWLRTHPSTDERVERLLEMASGRLATPAVPRAGGRRVVVPEWRRGPHSPL